MEEGCWRSLRCAFDDPAFWAGNEVDELGDDLFVVCEQLFNRVRSDVIAVTCELEPHLCFNGLRFRDIQRADKVFFIPTFASCLHPLL